MEIGRLAERQHGVVSLTQLQSFGLSKSGVAKRARAGRLRRIHRGVYAVGHGRLTMHGRWMAAVLAHGPRAVLSHRSAAGLHGIRPDNRPNTDVTVPSPSAASRSGIDVHTSATLQPADVTVVDGIPCTSLARTLLDLADVLDERGVERAIDQAEVLRLFDRRGIDDVLSRAAGRRGAGVLHRLLAQYDRPSLTESEFEEVVFGLCREGGLSKPEANAWIMLEDGAVKVDFLWRAERLIVETDGWRTHGTRRAFERDRRRDRRLQLAGWQVVRFTWRDTLENPSEVLETLTRLLQRRRTAERRSAAERRPAA